jgi:hypothetical protein
VTALLQHFQWPTNPSQNIILGTVTYSLPLLSLPSWRPGIQHTRQERESQGNWSIILTSPKGKLRLKRLQLLTVYWVALEASHRTSSFLSRVLSYHPFYQGLTHIMAWVLGSCLPWDLTVLRELYKKNLLLLLLASSRPDTESGLDKYEWMNQLVNQ